jgi:hypothetical protein
MHTSPTIDWTFKGEVQSLRWHSESLVPPPKKIIVADDTLAADKAYKLVCEGTGLIWQGDFQNGKLLLQALARRVDRKQAERKPAATLTESFHQHRQAQAQRARILGMILIPIAADLSIPLRRAPAISEALLQVYGKQDAGFVVSLRELQSVIGAYEWRKKGVMITALGNTLHPHYGVFSPVRGEYLDLIAKADLPTQALAFDIGTGTGVIAALLARRGVQKIIATDQDDRALICAKENIKHLGVAKAVAVTKANLFPEGRAPLVVCNPPWIPAKPSSPIEYAIYDYESQMLKGFLKGLPDHLTPDGQGWLILSDLAEHLGLRSRAHLLTWIDEAGLKIIGRDDILPRHGKAVDKSDPLFAARSKEITSLFKLALK